MGEVIVLPGDAPERTDLEAQGWVVTARSFGAQLDASGIDEVGLRKLVDRAAGSGLTRELGVDDVGAALKLDAGTVLDYPGSAATRHEPLDARRATPCATRRAFVACTTTGELVAMTFVDIRGLKGETDFTVVHRAWRGRGLGTAVKAHSVLTLSAEGVSRFRTGGSLDNTSILSANKALGYVLDETWVTLELTAR